ncbi:hypothetical protein LOCC1_G001362 [Lachnellula occidentalis]|uniref:Uncharacterized protein n=1 Tax=Lachnellula occidentalis TaxID=215460 RepID=A0A8H8S908_9HELO|nr:hypothetical protein LOCC1_G001362 [Lachnellula occidentalis]
MARNRKEKDPKIKLKQPDRSGPDPSRETLLQLAGEHGLLDIPQAVGKDKAKPAEDEEPLIGRLPESAFWSISLTMLHFTMDVLVARQFAVEMEWDNLMTRSAQAFPGMLFQFKFGRIYTNVNSTNSISVPHLFPTSPPDAASPAPTSTSTNTIYPTPNTLLHKQHMCRKLSHTYHKHV